MAKKKAKAKRKRATKATKFKKVKIVFPFLQLDDPCIEPLIHVDFREKKQALPEDRCLCGSGLSFMACCGRTPGEIELLSGSF